jgi:hypothetical protein
MRHFTSPYCFFLKYVVESVIELSVFHCLLKGKPLDWVLGKSVETGQIITSENVRVLV